MIVVSKRDLKELQSLPPCVHPYWLDTSAFELPDNLPLPVPPPHSGEYFKAIEVALGTEHLNRKTIKRLDGYCAEIRAGTYTLPEPEFLRRLKISAFQIDLIRACLEFINEGVDSPEHHCKLVGNHIVTVTSDRINESIEGSPNPFCHFYDRMVDSLCAAGIHVLSKKSSGWIDALGSRFEDKIPAALIQDTCTTDERRVCNKIGGKKALAIFAYYKAGAMTAALHSWYPISQIIPAYRLLFHTAVPRDEYLTLAKSTYRLRKAMMGNAPVQLFLLEAHGRDAFEERARNTMYIRYPSGIHELLHPTMEYRPEYILRQFELTQRSGRLPTRHIIGCPFSHLNRQTRGWAFEIFDGIIEADLNAFVIPQLTNQGVIR